MSKTSAKYNKFVGYKFFKDDSLVRLIRIYDFNDKIMVKDLNTGFKKVINLATLQGYTPIEPYGIIIFNEIYFKSHNKDRKEIIKDIVVSGYRLIDLKVDINEPFVICRQGVTDFFYTIIANKINDTVGVSVTREDCPTNIEYKMMAACDGINQSNLVNFYIDDALNDILECINEKPYDLVLEELYKKHVISECNPLLLNAKSHKGWCRSLRNLLEQNNFLTDLDAMRGITAVTFKIEDYLIKDDNDILTFNNSLLYFFDKTFKVNAVKANTIQYGPDVDLGEFNKTTYTLIRDIDNKLWIVVYKCEGEYSEKELEERNKEPQDITSKLAVQFYDKYLVK